jgi:hypothetical protein
MMSSILTVTTAASSYDLTTLANVKDELSVTDGTSDAVLRRYISSASTAAQSFCNRVFALETVSEAFFPETPAQRRLSYAPVGPLQLTRWPLVTVTSVTEDGTLLVVGDDYVVDYTTGQLTRVDDDGLVLAWPRVLITVVYSAGYATTPSDLEDAVIRMVTQRYSAKGRDGMVRQEAIPGLIERQYWVATGADAGNITPDVGDILDRYRVNVVA